MKGVTALPLGLLIAQAYAFKNTEPLLAWRSGECQTAIYVSAPGLLSTDFAYLDSSAAIRSAFDTAEKRVYEPYVPVSDSNTAALDRLACSNIGENGSVHIVIDEGLTAASCVTQRQSAMRRLDDQLRKRLDDLPSSHMVIIAPRTKPVYTDSLRKRQISVADDFIDSQTSTFDSFVTIKPTTGPAPFVAPKQGILDTYVFVSPVLIISTLIIFLIFIPVALLPITALMSVQLPKGLETGKSFGGGSDRKDQ